MYQHENYSNVWQSKDRDCVCVFENDEYTVYKDSVKKTCDYKGFIIRETDYYGNTIEYIRDEDEKIKFIKFPIKLFYLCILFVQVNGI